MDCNFKSTDPFNLADLNFVQVATFSGLRYEATIKGIEYFLETSKPENGLTLCYVNNAARQQYGALLHIAPDDVWGTVVTKLTHIVNNQRHDAPRKAAQTLHSLIARQSKINNLLNGA